MVVDGLEVAYRRHATELVRYATAMVGPHDAPDVVADAMVRVFATADLSGVDDVRAYLYRAVHHRVIDLERAGVRRRRREAGVAASRPRAVDDDPAEAADARAALGALSVQQRTAVFMTYWCGLTPAEVARVLDTSEGTVRKQLARARARLREVLDG
jgi:RNA polymerase sigma factor (sigma-70 family)